MPSCHTALCLLASMDPLVLSRSSRALLALVRSSNRSTEGLTLLLLETAAIGEILVGMSSREVSASLTLTWDEVSTAWTGPSGFQVGVMRTTAVVGLLGDEHSDSQLDTSSTAQDRRLLTSVVILPSDFGEIYVDWLSGGWRPCRDVVSFGLVPPWGVKGYQSPGRHVCLL